MGRIIVALVLSVFGSAQAANVTIDFEQFSGVVNSFQQVGESVVLNDGFVMSGNDALWLAEDIGPSQSIEVVFNPGGYATLSKSDGSTFDLLSFDYAFINSGTWPITITAIKAGGAEVVLALDLVVIDANYSTYVADSLFTNIVSLNILDSVDGAPMALDNIKVSTVPVPAAVWLFGSGLGLLGWMRRKATV